MAKTKYYVDKNHPEKGIYYSWADCEKEKAKGGTNFYSFPSEVEAYAAIESYKSGGATVKTAAPKAGKTTSSKSLVPGTYIGSDEVGKGEPLKQLIAVAVYVSADGFVKMQQLGVDDSKKIPTKIETIGKQLTSYEAFEDVEFGVVKENPEYGLVYCPMILTNKEYNKIHSVKNQNQVLSEIHNEANAKLYDYLKNKGIEIASIVIDNYMGQYTYNFDKYLKDYTDAKIKDLCDVHFEVHADGTYKEIVGTSSVICAYIDKLWQKHLNAKYGTELDYGNNINLQSLKDSFECIMKRDESALDNIKHNDTYEQWKNSIKK